MLSCGWSVGPVFAFHAALELETFISCPRAVFAFDSRGLPLVGVCAASRNLRSISRASRVSLRARALVNFCSMEVARFRFPDPTHRFTCPLMQHENARRDDCAIESRRQFYAEAGCADSLPNSTHMTIGSDHYWDIARRMRKDLSQRAAIVRVEDCEHPAADCPWGAEDTIRRPAARRWILAYSGTRRPLAEGHTV